MDSDETVLAANTGVNAAVKGNVQARAVTEGLVQRPTTREDGMLAVPPDAVADNEETPLLAEELDGRTISGHDDEGDGGDGGEFDDLPWYNRPSIYWMLFPFAFFTLSFGGTLVPKLNLILALVCRSYMADQAASNPGQTPRLMAPGASDPQCRMPEVSARAAEFMIYGNLISGILAAIVGPRLGKLSDTHGRKAIIILTSCGTICGEIVAIIAAKRIDTFAPYLFLISFALDGLCGSFTTSMAITHSYAADCTSPKRRGVAFGYFHACLFTGIALGPLLAGLLAKLTSSLASVFIAAAVIQVLVLTFIGLFVPESLTKTRQLAAREKRRLEQAVTGRSSRWMKTANPFEPLKILYPTGEGSSSAVRRNLVTLAAIDTVILGVAMGSGSVVIYYAEYQFGWDTFESSVFLSTVSFCRVFALLVALPLVNKLVRGSAARDQRKSSGSDLFDLMTIRFSIFVDTLGYTGYIAARSGSLFTLSAAVAAFGAAASPTLQSALTKHVPPDRTGQVLGASGLLHALARVVGPTIFNGIYRSTVGKFSQTLFVCLAGIFFLSFLGSWFLKPHVYLDEPAGPHVDAQPVDTLDEEFGGF